MFNVNKLIYISPIFFLAIVIILLICIISYNHIVRFFDNKKIIKKIYDFSSNPNCSLKKVLTHHYDYILELKNTIYYIKLIKVPAKKDLYIIDETNVYFKGSKQNDVSKQSYIIKYTLSCELPKNANKEVKRLLILNPSPKFIFIRYNNTQFTYLDFDNEFNETKIISCEDFLNLEELK